MVRKGFSFQISSFKLSWLFFLFLISIFYYLFSAPYSAIADTSFTAGEAISIGNVLVLQGAANTVYKTSAQGQTGIVGVAANDAGAGAAVYVRQSGGKVPVDIVGTVAKGNVLRASATAGAAENAGGMTTGAFAIAAADGSGGQCTATLMLGLQGSGIIASHSHTESDISDLDHDAQEIKGKALDDSGIADGKIWKYEAASDSWVIGDDAGAATGAPAGAAYITQTHDAALTNEQALSDLATGLLKNITATGVLEIAVAGTDYAAAIHSHSASDVDDFDTGVSNNADVSANAAHRSATANVHGFTYTAEGAGGGLDADTVDGDHAADFASAGHAHDSDYGSLSGESSWSGEQDFSGATLSMPNSADPDLNAPGQVSYDTNDHATRTTDGARQFGHPDYPGKSITVLDPENIPTVAGRGTQSFTFARNTTNLVRRIVAIYAISDEQNYTFKLFKSASATDIGTANDAQIDEVVCSSAGTSGYYATIESGFDSDTQEPDTYLIFEHVSGIAGMVNVEVKYYYDADND